MNQRLRRQTQGVLIAVLMTIGVALVRVAISPGGGDRAPLLSFLFAVLVAAWRGGFWPGMLATMAGAIAGSYSFVSPRGLMLPARADEWAPVALFLGVGAMVSWMSEALIAARERSEDRRRDLERAVGELSGAEANPHGVLRQAATSLESIREQADLLDLAHDAIVVRSTEGIITFWNRGAEKMYGWPRDRAIGQQVHALLKTEFPRPLPDILAEIARHGWWEGTLVHTRRDGSRIMVASRWASRSDQEKSDQGVVLQIDNDITGQRRVEAALRDSEIRQKAIVEAAVDGIITIDERGIIGSVNPAVEKIFGYAAEEVVGRNVSMLMPEPYRSGHDGYLAHYRDTGERKIIGSGREVAGRRKDGSVFPLELAVSEAHLGDRRIFTGIVRDVTERKRAEASLRESEHRLRLALEAGRMGTWQWELDTNQVTWSPALEAIHGLAPGTFGGTFAAYEKDIHTEDRAQVLRSISRSVEQGEEHHVEYRVVWPNGSIHWVEGRGKLFRDESGKPTRMIGICIDITERKRAEEALKEADQRKDEFLAMLSHELRNPLAPIRNAVQILKAEEGVPESDRIWTRGVIDRQVRHLARLVDDLLDVSRISANKLQIRREPVELRAIIESAVETSSSLVEEAKHRLTVTLPAEALHLEADPIRLAQVFSNLLNNAAMYTEHGGAISLAAEREGSDVIVSVVDSGVGIPAELLPRVFDLFSQGSTARSGSGLGVGLSLAKVLVDLHGGSIDVCSDGPGTGSRFIVRLPLAVGREPGQPPAALPSVREPAVKQRILIADDLQDAADSLAILLRIAGHEVEIAYDGKKALERAEALRPEVALLDIGMPKVNGYEVARRIRAQPWGQSMFLIALTGWGQEEDRRRAEEAGFDAHLVKPVSSDMLKKLLRAISVPSTEPVAP